MSCLKSLVAVSVQDREWKAQTHSDVVRGCKHLKQECTPGDTSSVEVLEPPIILETPWPSPLPTPWCSTKTASRWLFLRRNHKITSGIKARLRALSTDRQTETENWDKACFGFTSVLNVKIYKTFPIRGNVQAKLKFYLSRLCLNNDNCLYLKYSLTWGVFIF